MDVLNLIGNTPIVELASLLGGRRGRLFAKCEFLNPTGSKKDRVATRIIEDAEAEGRLKRGQGVVELTSGNTGAALAAVCRAKGYSFTAFMSVGNSAERAMMMRAYGAELVLVEQAPGSKPGRVSGADLALVDEAVSAYVEEHGAYRADQFNNISNSRAHELGTAPEIIKQLDGRVDFFADFIGTGGSYVGCARAFKRYGDVQCFVVEPEGAAVLSGAEVTEPSHPIQGGGYSKADISFLDEGMIDGFVSVSAEEAVYHTRLLAERCGLFTGFSSGANVCAALKLLANEMSEKTGVVLLNDHGLKYTSTALWEAQ